MAFNDHRDKADRFLTPIAKMLPNMNPNQISRLSLVFAFLGGLTIYLSEPTLLPLAFISIFLNSYLDALDGKVAKLHNKATLKGDFLDHVGDRYADLFILLGISFSDYCALWIGVFAIIGVLMTSYMGTQAQALGVGRESSGILGRSERQVILMLFTLCQYWALMQGMSEVLGFTVLEYVMLFFAVVGNLNALHRASNTWKGL